MYVVHFIRRNSPPPRVLDYYIFIYIIIYLYKLLFDHFLTAKHRCFRWIYYSMRYRLVRAAAESKMQTEIDFKLTLPRNKLHPSTRYNARQPQTNALYNSSRRSLRGCIIICFPRSYLHIHDTIYTYPFNNVSALRLHFPVPFIFYSSGIPHEESTLHLT